MRVDAVQAEAVFGQINAKDMDTGGVDDVSFHGASPSRDGRRDTFNLAHPVPLSWGSPYHSLGPMITLQQLEKFFADTRGTHAAGRSSWSIDDICRWSYFFVDPDLNKLLPIADHMESLGYEIAGTLDPEAGDDDPVYYLQVDKVERHNPQSLHHRNQELYGIAEQFGVADYDGMDVGAVDGP